MTDPIRVVVADDHAVVREGLKLFLELQPDIEVVGEAADGEEAVQRAAETSPDVVLMDLIMPRTSGVEATLRIREASPGTQVLVLTSFLEDESVRDVLRAGALGYLLKDAHPSEVADGIRSVHRGDPLLHADVLRRVVSGFKDADSRPAPDRRPGTITIVFTDIENSTDLIRELGDDAARPIFREHDELIREVLAAHGGREVQHLGDGFIACFSSARAAVSFAIEAQRRFSSPVESDDPPVRIRIGMHTGEVIAEEHGLFGEAMWLAARVVSKANGGQIVLSDLTRRVVGSACACRDRGEFDLKGFPGMHRLFEVDWAEP